MKQPQKTPKKDKNNNGSQAYIGVGVVFFIVGVTSFATDSMSSMAFPFLALGIAFLGIAASSSMKQSKKTDEPRDKKPKSDNTKAKK